MKVAVYPGSFDPITLGHLDLIRRGLRIFDHLVIGVGVNSQKKPLFGMDLRRRLIQAAIPRSARPNVTVVEFYDMLGDFAKQQNAHFILRGMRTLSDFDFEFQIAFANQTLYPDLETVFVATDPKFAAVSSSVVREVLTRKGASDLGHFVAKPVAALIRKWIRQGEVKV